MNSEFSSFSHLLWQCFTKPFVKPQLFTNSQIDSTYMPETQFIHITLEKGKNIFPMYCWTGHNSIKCQEVKFRLNFLKSFSSKSSTMKLVIMRGEYLLSLQFNPDEYQNIFCVQPPCNTSQLNSIYFFKKITKQKPFPLIK